MLYTSITLYTWHAQPATAYLRQPSITTSRLQLEAHMKSRHEKRDVVKKPRLVWITNTEILILEYQHLQYTQGHRQRSAKRKVLSYCLSLSRLHPPSKAKRRNRSRHLPDLERMLLLAKNQGQHFQSRTRRAFAVVKRRSSATRRSPLAINVGEVSGHASTASWLRRSSDQRTGVFPARSEDASAQKKSHHACIVCVQTATVTMRLTHPFAESSRHHCYSSTREVKAPGYSRSDAKSAVMET